MPLFTVIGLRVLFFLSRLNLIAFTIVAISKCVYFEMRETPVDASVSAVDWEQIALLSPQPLCHIVKTRFY